MRIFVKLITGQVITLNDVDTSKTIMSVKQQCHKEGKGDFTPDQHRLVWLGRQLEDGQILSNYNITNEATLTLHHLASFRGATNIQIFVKLTNGQIITLNVEPSNTIASVKQKCQKEGKGGFSLDRDRLVYLERQLEDERTLIDYSITKDATLEAKPHHLIPVPRAPKMQIFVQLSTGPVITLDDVDPSETIASVKQKCQKVVHEGKEGCIPSPFTYAEKRLEDSRTLSYYNIANGATLKLCPTLHPLPGRALVRLDNSLCEEVLRNAGQAAHKLRAAFVEEEIDDRSINDLEETDFEAWGVKMGPRRRIMRLLRGRYRSSLLPFATESPSAMISATLLGKAETATHARPSPKLLMVVREQLEAAKAANNFDKCRQLYAQIRLLEANAAACVRPSSKLLMALRKQLEAAKAANEFDKCLRLDAQIRQLEANAAVCFRPPPKLFMKLRGQLEVAKAENDFETCLRINAKIRQLKECDKCGKIMSPQGFGVHSKFCIALPCDSRQDARPEFCGGKLTAVEVSHGAMASMLSARNTSLPTQNVVAPRRVLRSYRHMTVEERVRVLDKYYELDQNKKATVRWVKRYMGRDTFSPAAMRVLLRQEAEWRAAPRHKKKKRKRPGKGKFPEMEHALAEWIRQTRQLGIPVETFMIPIEARKLLKARQETSHLFLCEGQPGWVEPMKWSSTWVTAFMARFGFTLRAVTRTTAGAACTRHEVVNIIRDSPVYTPVLNIKRDPPAESRPLHVSKQAGSVQTSSAAAGVVVAKVVLGAAPKNNSSPVSSIAALGALGTGASGGIISAV